MKIHHFPSDFLQIKFDNKSVVIIVFESAALFLHINFDKVQSDSKSVLFFYAR